MSVLATQMHHQLSAWLGTASAAHASHSTARPPTEMHATCGSSGPRRQQHHCIAHGHVVKLTHTAHFVLGVNRRFGDEKQAHDVRVALVVNCTH